MRVDAAEHHSEKLLTTPEAAAQMGVTPNYLEKLRISGGGPEFVRFGRLVRYEPNALRVWIAAARRRSTSAA